MRVKSGAQYTVLSKFWINFILFCFGFYFILQASQLNPRQKDSSSIKVEYLTITAQLALCI